MPFPRHAQLRYLALLLGLWLGTFVLTRSALLVAHWQEATAGPLDILRIYAEGAIYDLAYLAFAAVPLALYLALCPRKIWPAAGTASACACCWC